MAVSIDDKSTKLFGSVIDSVIFWLRVSTYFCSQQALLSVVSVYQHLNQRKVTCSSSVTQLRSISTKLTKDP